MQSIWESAIAISEILVAYSEEKTMECKMKVVAVNVGLLPILFRGNITLDASKSRLESGQHAQDQPNAQKSRDFGRG